MTETPVRKTGLPNPADASSVERPLESWKEIAAYLQRDTRTIRRWEQSEALPVHRHRHAARSSVYAYPSELDRWRVTRQPGAEPTPSARPPWRRPLPSLAFGLVLLVTLAAMGDGGPEAFRARAQGQPGAVAAGLTARQVLSGGTTYSGGVSPDGRYMSLVDGRGMGDLVLRDLTSGQTRYLTTDASWGPDARFASASAFSADSTQIAYSWLMERPDGPRWQSETRIVGVDGGIDGGQPRVLYRSEDVELQPVEWSRDGQQILALLSHRDGTFQIGLVSTRDGAVRVVKSLEWRWPSKMSLSPDGRYIVYDAPDNEDSAERDIFLLGVPFGSVPATEIRLIEHPAVDWGPVWTPDGRHVVFISDRGGTAGLWVLAVDDGVPQGSPRLVKADVGTIALGFAGNGSFYYGSRGGSFDVYVAELDPVTGKVSGAPTRLVESFVGRNSSPGLSSDGQYLAYSSRRTLGPGGSGVRLVIRSLDTGEERMLPVRPEHQVVPNWNGFRWSPDGRYLVAGAEDAKGRWGLYRIDVQTGDVTSVKYRQSQLNFPRFMHPTWSKDGNAIFYTTGVEDSDGYTRAIVRRDVRSGDEQELTRADCSVLCFANLAVSPDGRQLAFGGSSIGVIPTSGGEPRIVHRFPEGDELFHEAGIAWTPDGQFLLFAQVNANEGQRVIDLFRVSIDGGEPQELGLSHRGPRLFNLGMHPDGRRIVFSAQTRGGGQNSSLWMLENLADQLRASR